jgi:hypothetical protein
VDGEGFELGVLSDAHRLLADRVGYLQIENNDFSSAHCERSPAPVSQMLRTHGHSPNALGRRGASRARSLRIAVTEK